MSGVKRVAAVLSGRVFLPTDRLRAKFELSRGRRSTLDKSRRVRRACLVGRVADEARRPLRFLQARREAGKCVPPVPRAWGAVSVPALSPSLGPLWVP